jgi:hypothetical protein
MEKTMVGDYGGGQDPHRVVAPVEKKKKIYMYNGQSLSVCLSHFVSFKHHNKDKIDRDERCSS